MNILEKRKDIFLLDDAVHNLVLAKYNVDVVNEYLKGIVVDDADAADPNREDVIINKLFYEEIVMRVTKYNVITSVIMKRIDEYKKGGFFQRKKGERLYNKLIKIEHEYEDELRDIITYMSNNVDG